MIIYLRDKGRRERGRDKKKERKIERETKKERVRA